MAPPAHRRSGINKKAQLGVFTGYVVAGLGALFGAALLAISLLRPETFNGLRSMASDAAAPIGAAGASARTNSQGVLEAIEGYYRAGSRNAELAGTEHQALPRRYDNAMAIGCEWRVNVLGG